MTEPSDDFVAAWEHIIADITKTDVPLECIKKVVLKFHGGRQKTFNLATLKNNCWTWKKLNLCLPEF